MPQAVLLNCVVHSWLFGHKFEYIVSRWKVLHKVAENAIACKWVLILFWGIFFPIRIDMPPEALCPVSCI